MNHTIVDAEDNEVSALFLMEMLGLPPPWLMGAFAVVWGGETSLDYLDAEGAMTHQPYAFLLRENEFDQIFERIAN